MTITAIKQQVKNAERVSIYLDGKYSFSLSLSQLLEFGLKVGLVLEQVRLEELLSASMNEKLRMKAMNWVFLRPRSTLELRQYLRRKNTDKVQDTDWIVDDFIRRKWIDDESFSRWWVSRTSRENKSKTQLRAELAAKGISRDVISEVLAEKHDLDALREHIRKLRTKAKYDDPQKMMRYLASKGFDYSSIKEALAVDDEGSSV